MGYIYNLWISNDVGFLTMETKGICPSMSTMPDEHLLSTS